MSLPDLKYVAVALFALLGLGLISFSQFSLSTVSGQSTVDLTSNSDWTGYSSFYESAEIYGNSISMENMGNYGGNTANVAKLNFDGESIMLDAGENYVEDGIKISNVRGTGQWMSGSCECYLAISYSLGIDVPDDRFSIQMSEVQVSDTGPGQRSVEYNVSVQNDWHRLNVGRLYADVAGEEIVLMEDALLPSGTTEFTVTDSISDYNSSKYIVEESMEKQTKVVIEDPSIPDGEKRIYGDKGSKSPDFNLEDIETEPVSFNVDYQFCGEAATYRDGECVLDEDLHLRGDTCFLPENYTIVTETFSPGTYDRSDVAPDPSYFCSRHPAIVTNDGVQSDRILGSYKSLVDSEDFTVPQGQTYTLFWVVNANEVEVNRVCEEGSLNKTTGNCVVKPGVVHKCSEGQWSAEQGSCVVNPDTKNICEKGRYNKELGVCVFNPPNQASCDRGEYDPDQESCVYTPETEAECDRGEFQSDTGTCVYEPPVKPECPIGSTLGEDGVCYSQASVQQVCPDGVNGSIQGGRCVTDAVTVARDNPLSSFRVFVFDAQNWFEENIFKSLPWIG